MPLLVTVRDGRGSLHELRIREKGPAGDGSDRYEVTDYVTERVVILTHARTDGVRKLVATALLALGQ
jgi:hypothetical protein